ncbi:MAG: ribonuclease P [Nanoarchaeota archaeon]|nr:ribonuclease P [Nanoarchaeota archaeon]MBU1135729.1 ribonuclease P [Nanoarchaeota archaeon]MBU2520094.1 ribonuclease P [Nanoarchaeota archaeon]
MGERKSKPKPEWQTKLAKERIEKLFKESKESFEKHPERSHRYVEMARKISMRYNIAIPRILKRKICKHCYKFLVSGKNAQVRTNSKHQAVIVKCLECGKVTRFPYRKEKKAIKKGRQLI